MGARIREIISDELLRINDDTTAYVTVTAVDVDPELTRAKVYLSTMDLSDSDIEGVRTHTGRIRRAIGRRARIKRVPRLDFQIDPGMRAGARVDEIIIDLARSEAEAATSERG